MDHYSLEILGKQKQCELVTGVLNEKKARKNNIKNHLRPNGTLIVTATLALTLIYFWLH